jgi:glucokinase
MNHNALGIDIGGTNIAFGIVNPSGEILYETNFPTKSFKTPENLVDFIYNHLAEKDLLTDLKGIGVGAPNGNHFTGEIRYAPNLQWKGIIPLAKLFRDKFNIETILTNDANAAAIGEKLFGCAKELENFVTITLGTGVGSGVFVGGEMVYGEHGVAGEYGHIRVIPNGRLCGCGRLGCLETYASSTGVVRSIHELDSPLKATSKLLEIENPSAKDVFEMALNGDAFAQEIVEFTAQILGSALADFACFSDPKAYVLFGGISQNGEAFAEKVKAHLEANILNIYKDDIQILISSLNNKNAAVLGNAASILWKSYQ